MKIYATFRNKKTILKIKSSLAQKWQHFVSNGKCIKINKNIILVCKCAIYITLKKIRKSNQNKSKFKFRAYWKQTAFKYKFEEN